MKRPRASLAVLMAFVGLVAVECAALASGTGFWYQAAYSATVFALLFAAAAARHRGPFWYGFAAVGWGYFLIGIGPWAGVSDQSPFADRRINEGVWTTYWLRQITDRLVVTPLAPDTPKSARAHPPIYFLTMRRYNTVAIGHTALTLLFACAGGALALALARRPEHPEGPFRDRAGP